MTRKGFAHLRWHSYEDLGNSYLSDYPTPPYQLVQYANNESDNFSFGLNHFIYFYVDMYKLSTDSSWLTLAADTCQHILDKTDAQRVVDLDLTVAPIVAGNPAGSPLDSYYQAPYPYQVNGTPVPGWSSLDGSDGRLRCQILQDGQICGALAYFADYIIDNNITAHLTLANTLFTHIAVVISSHDNSWRYDKVSTTPPVTVEGNWYYPERINGNNTTYSTILPFNHSAGACQAMLLYDKHFTENEYLNKVTHFMDFTRSNRDDLGDRFRWLYSLEQAAYEDLNHGSYSFMFFLTAYNNNYLNFTSSELKKYTNAALNAWYDTPVGNVAETINRDGTIPTGESFDPAHFSQMGTFNKELYKMVRDLTGTNYIASYANQYRAYAAIFNNFPSDIII